jgi:AraC-like DNA-binding protein
MPQSTRKNFQDYQNTPRPFSAMSNEYAQGEVVSHSHRRAQLVYAEKGVMEINAADRLWFVPPQRIFWIPSNIRHSMTAFTRVKTLSFFIDPDFLIPEMPKIPKVLNVTALLRELLIRASAINPLYSENGKDGAIMELVIKEMNWNETDPFTVSWPRDPRLKIICSGLKESPDDSRTLAEWGDVVGASPRTLSRLFIDETGLPFSLWRQHIRVLAAQPLLLGGASVGEVALSVGYENPSSFAAVFLRITGRQPHRFADLSD